MNSGEYIWFNGKLVPAAEAKVSVMAGAPLRDERLRGDPGLRHPPRAGDLLPDSTRPADVRLVQDLPHGPASDAGATQRRDHGDGARQHVRGVLHPADRVPRGGFVQPGPAEVTDRGRGDP